MKVIKDKEVTILVLLNESDIPNRREVRYASWEVFAVDVRRLIQGYMLVMMSVLAWFCYESCSEGKFECSIHKFPDISHVMGGPPLNKLYMMLLTLYSMIKVVETRTYHDRLSAIANPMINNAMIIPAVVAAVYGPAIGYYDVYYDVKTHVKVAGYFTLGELIYLLMIILVLVTNLKELSPNQRILTALILFLFALVVAVGVVMTYRNDLGLNGYAVNQIGEWVAFYLDFIIRMVLAELLASGYREYVRSS